MDGGAPFQTPRRPAGIAEAFKTPLRTPLEQTSKTPIIDMALAIESQKENVIPRAKGRSASALHNTLTLQHRERAEKLAAERAAHEARVHSEANAESEDPLEAWDAYVRWTIDAYPAGQTAESGLVPLLELATRTFFGQRVYAQDVRYLRFWVLYANNCEDRRQIFKFLLANEVGTNWATLYEELANVLEANTLYDEADETYKLGINRRAHPLDRLNRRYTEYQQRILHRPEASELGGSGAGGTGSTSYTAALKAAMASAKRSMLGTKLDAKAGGPSMSANSMRGFGLSNAGLNGGGSGSAATSSTTSTTSAPGPAASASNVKKLAVYRDDDEDEDGLGAAGARKNAKGGSSSGGSEWDSLGSKVQRQQENKPAAKAWAGEKMASRTPGKPGAAPISVFRDSDDEDAAPAAGAAVSRTPRPGLGTGASGRVALAPALSETDQLRQNPFLRWDKDVLNGTGRKAEAEAEKEKEAASAPATGAASASSTSSKTLEAAETKKSSKKSKSSSSSSSRSAHKSSSGSSLAKGKESSSSSKLASSSSSSTVAPPPPPAGLKRERHAFPILLLYPHLATLEEVVTSFEGGQTRWTEPSGERCIDEILLAKRGIPCGDADADADGSAASDPWAYLDERVGVPWPPPAQKKVEEAPKGDVEMQMDPRKEVSSASSRAEQVPVKASSNSSASSSSQDRTGSHKRKRGGDGDTTGHSIKMKPKPQQREVTQTVTMFTKAAELDVRGMFNGDDSEDSDDDDDDDEEEESEEELSASSHRRPVPPTPSARNMSGPAGTGAGAVPATPASQRALVDENGEPLLMSGRRLPSVSRSGGGGGVLAPRVVSDPLAALGTVSATPIRAPLVARVPFEKVSIPGASAGAGSGAGGLGSALSSQAQAQTKPATMLPPPVPRSVSVGGGATRVPQRMEVFREEDEEEGEGEDENIDGGQTGQGEDHTPEDGNGDELLANGTHVYHALTPITEATEFTRFTARTARTPGTASRPCRTDASRDLLGQWNYSRRGAAARGSLARDDEDSSSSASSSDEEEGEDPQIPKLMVLTDAQRQQMARESGSATVSGSLGELGPSTSVRQTRETNVFGPASSMSVDHEAASTSLKNEIADRSDASSHGFPALAERPLEPTGHWDRPRTSSHDLSGVLIEKHDTAGSSARLVHQDFGSSLLISDCQVDEVMAPLEQAAESSSRAAVAGEEGGFVIPNPCPPVDADIISHILRKLENPIEALPHYVDLRSQSAGGMLDTLQSAVRSATRKSLGGASIARNGQVKIQCELEIAGAPFHVRRKLGEGGYGAVFLADDLTSFAPSLRPQLCMAEPEDSMDMDDDDAKRKVAIKVEAPPNAWEFYVLHQLEMRLPPYVLPSLISARKLIAYHDESFLLLHYGDKGTLLDVVNGAAAAGVASSGIGGGAGGAAATGVDEVLAMFFTIELIRIVEQMHHCRFIHGDIKIDNCLLRLDEVYDESEWTPKYAPSGTGCWAAKGMILIDFGRAIDLSCYPPGQTFVADWEADERDCLQMREGKPWVYEADYYGIAAVAHCLLFGKYIETKVEEGRAEQDGGGKRLLKLVQPLRRYWQGEIWGRLFDLLLNPAVVTGKPSFEPVIEELAEVRGEMEAWLEANSNRAGKNLRGMLKKLELWAMKRNE
ncbi:protein kinase [Tilletia horrida]|nr:protein kinase [Tilletia horrida]